MRTKEKIEKKGISKAIILPVLVIITIIIIAGFAYARYEKILKGQITAEGATMICNMQVVPGEEDITVVNPYCIITVNNFETKDGNEVINEANLDFEIEVTSKTEGFEIPEYYWLDSSGNLIENGNSKPLKGSFGNGQKETQEYKIVFINSGDKQIETEVNFDLIVSQAEN